MTPGFYWAHVWDRWCVVERTDDGYWYIMGSDELWDDEYMKEMAKLGKRLTPPCTQDDGTPWSTKWGCGGEKCDECEP